jgi:hypothetical protein
MLNMMDRIDESDGEEDNQHQKSIDKTGRNTERKVVKERI